MTRREQIALEVLSTILGNTAILQAIGAEHPTIAALDIVGEYAVKITDNLLKELDNDD